MTAGRAYNNWTSYGQSKLANLLFAKELADQFEAEGKPIKVSYRAILVVNTVFLREIVSMIHVYVRFVFL